MRQQSMSGRSGARGISLIGLLFWAVFLACGGVVVARVAPTVMEFYTIQGAVNRIAKNNPARARSSTLISRTSWPSRVTLPPVMLYFGWPAME